MSAGVRMGRLVKDQRSRELVRHGAELRSSSVSSVALPDRASSSFRLFSAPQVKVEWQN